jgi:hypothetical protein
MNTEMLNQLLQLTVWLPIKGYDNYEVSICGSIRSSKTKRILKPYIFNGYFAINLYQRNIRKMHKIHSLVVKTFIPNIGNKKWIDHIDNDKLNNTISNLRWCSSQENNHNRSLSKNNTSSIKGVSWNKRFNKWEVYIMFNYKRIHIGLFTNLEDAKIARQNKAKELYGDFINSCEL